MVYCRMRLSQGTPLPHILPRTLPSRTPNAHSGIWKYWDKNTLDNKQGTTLVCLINVSFQGENQSSRCRSTLGTQITRLCLDPWRFVHQCITQFCCLQRHECDQRRRRQRSWRRCCVYPISSRRSRVHGRLWASEWIRCCACVYFDIVEYCVHLPEKVIYVYGYCKQKNKNKK